MADAFMAAVFGSNTVKASARFKDVATGKMKTVTLHRVPADLTDEAFIEAAKHGIDVSAKAIGKDADRSKNIVGKGCFGDLAVGATANVVGFTLPEPEPKSEPESTLHGAAASSVVAKTIGATKPKGKKDTDAVPATVGTDGFAK